MKYQDYIITYRAKPVPTNVFDWEFAHQDYDGPGDPRCGTAASYEEAILKIQEISSDHF